ncbi:MAG TPA: 7TM diverse intracellular signaling domain-containing protein [Bdellovibrionota bacterium]|jgi:signal transduction histidine kinase
MDKVFASLKALLAAVGLALFLMQAALADPPPSMEYFEDSSKEISAEDVIRKPRDWRPVTRDHPRLGFSFSRFWFRFQLPNDGRYGSPKETLFFEILSTYLGRVGFYSTVDGKILESAIAGLDVPVSQREPQLVLPTGPTIFRLATPRDPRAVYFLSVEGTYPLEVSMTVRGAATFIAERSKYMMMLGGFFGLLVLAALFNSFLAGSLRSWMYFNYSLFIFSIAFLYLGHEGLTVQFFWPENPWWAAREMHIYGGISLFFYAQFVREFLGSREITPKLDRVLIALVAVSTVRMAWAFFHYSQLTAMVGSLSVTLSNLVVLVIASIGLAKRVKAAILFFVSSLVFNLSMILFAAQESGLIYLGEFMRHAPHIGTSLEVILLSLALADRIRASDRELAEQRAMMMHSEKMSALGRMAGELAHEINNPLAIIHGNAVMLRNLAGEGKPAQPKMAQMAETIEHTVNRISKLVKGMRALARDSKKDPFQDTPVSSVIQDALGLCQDRARKVGVEIAFQNPEKEPHLKCRSSEICQVLVNLLNNSIDAVEGSASPWIKVDVQTKGDRVEIVVEDNGHSVPKEIRSRIYEPFFTTKEAGKGLGLGLSVSRTIVEGHGGTLLLDEESATTRFVLSIPAPSLQKA